jgi:hypothetical protein
VKRHGRGLYQSSSRFQSGKIAVRPIALGSIALLTLSMTGEAAPQVPSAGPRPPWALIAIGLALTAGAGLLIGRCTADPPSPAPVSSVTTIRATPSVVTAIRDLSRLESSQYHVERVIDLTETQKRFFDLLEAKDAILLIAAGDVTAGIDLSELAPADVVIDDATDSAVITLPPPRILSQRLDNERTYVHSRKTDVLAERKETLETQARKEAERSIVQAALESGILDRAGKNAARTIESLVRSLGYRRVEVRVRPAEAKR